MGMPVVPPIAMSSASLRMIANRKRGPSSEGSRTYSVPPAACVIAFAATRIFSRRWSMFFSWDSAEPISLSCSRRRNRSSSVSTFPPGGRPDFWRRRTALLYADCPHLRHVGDALKHFFDPVHLQGAHAFFQGDGEDLGDAGVLLDELLEVIGGDQQLVQADPPLVAGVAARV